MKVECAILTKEEKEVLLLAATHPNGRYLSNIEIARSLNISVSKVKLLIHHACIKLEADNRIEALLFAILKGEIRVDEIFTLDELAEILSALGTDVFRMLMHLIHDKLSNLQLPWNGEQIGCSNRKQELTLTEGEQDVLRLAGRGLTNREIADALYMTNSTVRTYIHRACTKLGAHNRLDAVVLALKRGDILVSEVLSHKELLENLALLETEYIEELIHLRSQKLRQEPVADGSLYIDKLATESGMDQYPVYVAVP